MGTNESFLGGPGNSPNEIRQRLKDRDHSHALTFLSSLDDFTASASRIFRHLHSNRRMTSLHPILDDHESRTRVAEVINAVIAMAKDADLPIST